MHQRCMLSTARRHFCRAANATDGRPVPASANGVSCRRPYRICVSASWRIRRSSWQQVRATSPLRPMARCGTFDGQDRWRTEGSLARYLICHPPALAAKGPRTTAGDKQVSWVNIAFSASHVVALKDPMQPIRAAWAYPHQTPPGCSGAPCTNCASGDLTRAR